MTLTIQSFDAALKQYYTPDSIQNVTYKKNPFHAIVPKMEKFYGKNLPVPLIYANPQGRSATFSRALARAASSDVQVSQFLMTRAKDYGIVNIDNETMEASANDKGAFLRAQTAQIDGILHSVTRSVAQKEYRSGYGEIGRMSNSGFATTALTLTDPTDATNFEIGQELMLASSLTTASRALAGSSGMIVTGVNRTSGTITVSANISTTIAGAAQNDFIFIRGDHTEPAATVSRLCMTGLGGWLPYTAPTGGDSFFGVDRSVDPTRLAGQRLDGSSMPIEEAAIELAVQISKEGGSPDYFFINPQKFASLEKSMGSKVNYVNVSVGDIGFTGIRIIGQTGPIKVLPDQNCPNAYGYMITRDTWELGSLKGAIRMLNSDGLEMLRQSGEDGVEVRVGGYMNLWCNAPGWNGVVQF